MKILLTGCNGQVGWEICQQAESYLCSVVPTDIHNLDITDIDAIRAIQATELADVIINSAAYTAVDKAESDRDLAYAVNATGAANLARVAAECNIPILHISTDYIFSGNQTRPYTEADLPDPTGVYGETKLAGEKLVAEANPQHVTLRTSWVFGIEGNNFVKTMLRIGEANDEITVVADQFGSPTFAGHIARALLMLASQYQQSQSLTWGTFNFCDSGPTTWHGFATRILRSAEVIGLVASPATVRPIRTEEYPTAAARPAYSVMDCNLFNRTYPHIGLQSWDEGLDRMLKALQANQ